MFIGLFQGSYPFLEGLFNGKMIGKIILGRLQDQLVKLQLLWKTYSISYKQHR